MKFSINLNKFENIIKFAEIARKFDSDIDVYSGRYIVNAKSVMGLYTLDLSKNIEVKLFTDDDNLIEEFKQNIKEFIVK